MSEIVSVVCCLLEMDAGKDAEIARLTMRLDKEEARAQRWVDEQKRTVNWFLRVLESYRELEKQNGELIHHCRLLGDYREASEYWRKEVVRLYMVAEEGKAELNTARAMLADFSARIKEQEAEIAQLKADLRQLETVDEIRRGAYFEAVTTAQQRGQRIKALEAENERLSKAQDNLPPCACCVSADCACQKPVCKSLQADSGSVTREVPFMIVYNPGGGCRIRAFHTAAERWEFWAEQGRNGASRVGIRQGDFATWGGPSK